MEPTIRPERWKVSQHMTESPDMSCRELVKVVTDYLEGTLADGDRRRLEECPYCVIYIEQMRETIDALGRLSEESIAPETRQELVEAFRGWRDR